MLILVTKASAVAALLPFRNRWHANVLRFRQIETEVVCDEPPQGGPIQKLQGARATILQYRPTIVVEMHPNVWASANTTRASTERLLLDLHLKATPLSGQRDPLEDHGQVWLEPR